MQGNGTEQETLMLVALLRDSCAALAKALNQEALEHVQQVLQAFNTETTAAVLAQLGEFVLFPLRVCLKHPKVNDHGRILAMQVMATFFRQAKVGHHAGHPAIAQRLASRPQQSSDAADPTPAATACDRNDSDIVDDAHMETVCSHILFCALVLDDQVASPPCSEELLQATVTTLRTMLDASASATLRPLMSSLRSRAAQLGHAIHALLRHAAPETPEDEKRAGRTLRVTCLQTLARLLSLARHHGGATLPDFFPGLLTRLSASATGSAKTHHTVVCTSLDTIAVVVSAVLAKAPQAVLAQSPGDSIYASNAKDIEAEATVTAAAAATAVLDDLVNDYLSEQSAASLADSSAASGTEGRDRDFGQAKSLAWWERCLRNTGQVLSRLTQLCSHASPSVRLAVMACCLTCAVRTSVRSPVILTPAVDVIATLAGDEFPHVRHIAKTCASRLAAVGVGHTYDKHTAATSQAAEHPWTGEQLSKAMTVFLPALTERILVLTSELPRIFMQSNDQDISTALARFVGYLRLCGRHLSALLRRPTMARRLSHCLIVCLQLERPDWTILHSFISNATDSSQHAEQARPRLKLSHKLFIDPRITLLFQEAFSLLQACPASVELVELILQPCMNKPDSVADMLDIATRLYVAALLMDTQQPRQLPDATVDVDLASNKAAFALELFDLNTPVLEALQSFSACSQRLASTSVRAGTTTNRATSKSEADPSSRHVQTNRHLVALGETLLRRIVAHGSSSSSSHSLSWVWQLPTASDRPGTVVDSTGVATLATQMEQLQLASAHSPPASANMLADNTAACVALLRLVGASSCLASVDDLQSSLIDLIYPLLIKRGSPTGSVASEAQHTLQLLAQRLELNNASSLLGSNSDYLLHEVASRLWYLESYPQAPTVLAVVLNHSGPDMINVTAHLLEEVRSVMDGYSDAGTSKSDLMLIMNSFATALERWLPALESNDADTGCDTDQQDDPPPPLHVDLAIKVLQPCIQYAAHVSARVRLLAVRTIRPCIAVLEKHERQLLPQLHQIWQTLLHRFNDAERLVSLAAVELLPQMCRGSGTFLRQRVAEECTPALEKELIASARADSAMTQEAHSINAKFQRAVFGGLAEVIDLVGCARNDVTRYVQLVAPFLDGSCQLADESARSFERLLESLKRHDEDRVWWWLASTQHEAEQLGLLQPVLSTAILNKTPAVGVANISAQQAANAFDAAFLSFGEAVEAGVFNPNQVDKQPLTSVLPVDGSNQPSSNAARACARRVLQSML